MYNFKKVTFLCLFVILSVKNLICSDDSIDETTRLLKPNIGIIISDDTPKKNQLIQSDDDETRISSLDIENNYQSPDLPFQLEEREFIRPTFFNDRPDQVASVESYICRKETETWDNTSKLMFFTDMEFFNKNISKKVKVAGCLGAVIGLIPSTPATGMVLYGIGDSLGLTIDGVASALIISHIMITMTPVFMKQFYKRGQIIMTYLAGEEKFKPGEENNKPYLFEKGWGYTGLKMLAGISSVIQGSYYFGLAYIAEAEGNFSLVAQTMGPVLGFAFAERYYSNGINSLDRLYVKYHDSNIIQQQRQILKNQAEQLLIEIEKNDELTRNIFSVIKEEINDPIFKEGKHRYFALSSLVLKHMMTQSKLAEDESDQQLQKDSILKALVDQLIPSTKEDFLSHLSMFCTSVGSVARLLGRQYIIERMLEDLLQIDPTIAAPTAYGISTVQMVLQNIFEHDTQQAYAKSWLNMFSLKHLVDAQIVRKGIGWSSLLDGAGFALTTAFASLRKLSGMSIPTPLQWALVLPAILVEQGNIASYHNEHANDIVTNIMTFKGIEAKTILGKRAYIHSEIQEFKKFIAKAGDETVSSLFDLMQLKLKPPLEVEPLLEVESSSELEP